MVLNLITEVLTNLVKIITLPFQDSSLLWQLAPIFLVWVFMTFYFGTHKKEELGWNTALGNGISLFWIIISALQFIFDNELKEFTYTKFYLIAIITIYAIAIIYISFKHSFSDKLTYALASPTPVYYFSALVLLYAHNLFELSLAMIIAIAVLFIIILILVRLIELLLPEMKEDENDDFDSKDDFGKDDDFKMKDEPEFNDLNKGFVETGDFKPNTFGDNSETDLDSIGNNFNEPTNNNPFEDKNLNNKLNI